MIRKLLLLSGGYVRPEITHYNRVSSRAPRPLPASPAPGLVCAGGLDVGGVSRALNSSFADARLQACVNRVPIYIYIYIIIYSTQ